MKRGHASCHGKSAAPIILYTGQIGVRLEVPLLAGVWHRGVKIVVHDLRTGTWLVCLRACTALAAQRQRRRRTTAQMPGKARQAGAVRQGADLQRHRGGRLPHVDLRWPGGVGGVRRLVGNLKAGGAVQAEGPQVRLRRRRTVCGLRCRLARFVRLWDTASAPASGLGQVRGQQPNSLVPGAHPCSHLDDSAWCWDTPAAAHLPAAARMRAEARRTASAPFPAD